MLWPASRCSVAQHSPVSLLLGGAWTKGGQHGRTAHGTCHAESNPQWLTKGQGLAQFDTSYRPRLSQDGCGCIRTFCFLYWPLMRKMLSLSSYPHLRVCARAIVKEKHGWLGGALLFLLLLLLLLVWKGRFNELRKVGKQDSFLFLSVAKVQSRAVVVLAALL